MINKFSSKEINYKNLSESAGKIISLRDVEYKGDALERLNITIDEFSAGYKELLSKGYIIKHREPIRCKA